MVLTMEVGVVIVSKALDDLFDALPPRLSIEQLTDLLGLSDKQVTYRWLREGRVPAIKLGGSWLILRDDVKEHLNSHYNIPRSGAPAAIEGTPPEDV